MQDFSNPYGTKITENESLAGHCSMKTGGPSRYAAFPLSADALCALIEEASRKSIRYTVVGNGTNILFSDDGYDGMVIFTSGLCRTEWGETTVTAECGVPISKLACDAAARGLSGLEFAYGIPGTLGGAVYMNAGACGHAISELLVSSTAVSCGKLRERELSEHQFGYRKSVFMTNQDCILSATLRLTKDDPKAITARMKEGLAKRKATQPLEFPSAGSIFKRPEGHYAGALIEEAGLKGLRVGGAAVSEKHAGFIVNLGGASTNDVLTLMQIIEEKVYAHFGIRLLPEVVLVK